MKFNHFIGFILGAMIIGTIGGCAEEHEMELEDWCLYSGGTFDKPHQLCTCGTSPCDRGVFCIKEGSSYKCAVTTSK